MGMTPLSPFDLMATKKTYHGREDPVTFGKPTIGPRVYLTRGPSGWPETFDRRLADKTLESFLAPLGVIEVLEAFREAMRLEGARAYSWSDVVNYLAKITQHDWKIIPPIVSVAFWAQVLIYEEEIGAN